MGFTERLTMFNIALGCTYLQALLKDYIKYYVGGVLIYGLYWKTILNIV